MLSYHHRISITEHEKVGGSGDYYNFSADIGSDIGEHLPRYRIPIAEMSLPPHTLRYQTRNCQMTQCDMKAIRRNVKNGSVK